jgi:two-component system, cell cycle sensor histidine kinase and response regulator CckA
VGKGTELERRLEAAADLAIRIASGDLQVRLPTSEHSDTVDAVVAALNMLAEELQHERQTRRHTEELLQDELEGYEHAPALFCSLDAESLTVEKCNQTLAAALGRPKTSILGYSVLELYAAEQRASAERALRQVPLGAPLEQGDAQLCRAEGSTLVVSASATRVRGNDERERVRIVWRDVTKERGLEAQLIETQKLEAIGRLCGGVAHDFNNILAVVSGAASLTRALLVEKRLDDEDMALIQQAVGRGAALVNDLLAFSRRQVVKPVATNVRSIVEEAVRMVSRLVGSQIEVQSAIAELALTVVIDPSQLSQVLINLAINARDAMPNGGTLRLSASRLDVGRRSNVARGPMPPGSNEHLELPAGAYVLIEVADSGTGMAPNVLARAFEPFFTTKPVGSGSGLGLSMCYGIIQQAGGRIGIDSRLGQGTTVNVYLPRTSVASGPASRPEPSSLTESGRETLLVVEDDLAVSNVTRRILERAGYRVLVAENGRRALDAMERSTREISLVITDISMPGMSGQELGAELRHRRPKIKILYLSGYSPQVLVEGAATEVPTEFLGKPFTSAGLLEKVRRVLDLPS